jgi:hypothetical protein
MKMLNTQVTLHPSVDILTLIQKPEYAATRCWVYGSSIELDSQSEKLIEILSGFLSRWRADGLPISGKWQVLHKRFLVVLKDPDSTPISGCGMDSMVKDIKNVEIALQTQLLDSSRIFYQTTDGSVNCVNRPEFKQKVQAGEITLDTLVYNPILDTLQQLSDGTFEKPLKESWHLQLFDRALAK